VAEQDLLDFEGRDILTTTSDGVLEAIDKPKIAIGLANNSINDREVTPRAGAKGGGPRLINYRGSF
jgi:hypothetical protein